MEIIDISLDEKVIDIPLDDEITVFVRNATIDDFIAIYLLNIYGLGYDYPMEKTKKRVASILLNTNAKLLVAEVDGNVVGYAHAVDYDCSYSDSLKNLLAIAVDEEYKGKGVGRALITAVEKWALSSGSVGVRLVSSMYRTGSHKFYEKCGYSVRKDQKNYVKLF
ncbi:MAG: GNAT family N-acetyltransferase [Oscillospiraceae bacterium]|jgi:GNAT superfamily N-acetyltransferase|nr:GNAT family N-acetyltransferase [Oscillospiraceae bacterium]